MSKKLKTIYETSVIKPITEMYCYVMLDEQGKGEGFPAMFDSIHKMWSPMVGGDLDRIKSFEPIAKKIANDLGKSIKLLRFSCREEIEEILPEKVDNN